ncbi:MAG: hypothetical protein ABS939_08535 [Psychrobacillus sp.]
MLDYKELNDIDLKLHLQSGSDIKLGNLVIKPYTLEEIKTFGYTNYMSNLQLISISMDDFISSVVDMEKRNMLEEQRTNLRIFDFYVNLGGMELLDKLLQSLSMIFRTDDIRMLDESTVAIDFVNKGIVNFDEDGTPFINQDKLEELPEDEITIVHRDNFDDIVEIIKLQNYLSKNKSEKKEEKYADEETRKLMEDMERHRKRVEEKKKAQAKAEGNDDEVDISDIISAVSSKSNSVNKVTIWKYTLYQLYDDYSRLELIDNYNFSIKAIMAGAEKVDLKHWSSRI